jgi:transposase, IS5 family
MIDTSKDKGEDLYADSAHGGEEQLGIIKEKLMNNKVGVQGHKKSSLADQQKQSNRGGSKIRARIEYVFGFLEMNMNDMYMPCAQR